MLLNDLEVNDNAEQSSWGHSEIISVHKLSVLFRLVHWNIVLDQTLFRLEDIKWAFVIVVFIFMEYLNR